MIRKAIGAIIFQNNKYLVVRKTKINTKQGQETIKGEWDFIKGGMNESEIDIEQTLFRELEEETGSTLFKVVKRYDEKICFEFPEKIKQKIGYERQETTMFLVEYIGEFTAFNPIDTEISEICFMEKERVLQYLTHLDTKNFFIKHVAT